MIECIRSSVQTWECDQMGHMNVQFYVARADEGIATLASELGLRSGLQAQRAALLPREQHIRFHRELRPGAPYLVTGGVLTAMSEGFIFYQEMTNPVTAAVAATIVTRSEWCDLEYRGGLPVPATAIGLSAGLTTDLPAHGAPRGLDIYAPRPSPTPDEAEDLGLVTIYRGTVTDELCDSLGYMLPRYVIGRISDGIPNLLAQTSGHDRSNGKIGGAALEYRLIYRSPVHAGDIIVLRSGLRSVSSKTYVWCHWLFNAETGECCATAEAVAISMDLEARKAIEIPPAMHERLTSLIVPGLSL